MNKSLKTYLSILFCSILLLSLIFLISYAINRKYNAYEDYQKEKELEYWSVRYNLVELTQDYINTVAPGSDVSAIQILECCDKYNIDIRLLLSQGFNESHFGTKGLASKTNSIFNIGAYDSTVFDKILGIHKYSHPNKSIEPYCKLLQKNYLVNKTELDLISNFVDISGNRYASSSTYEKALRETWEKLNSLGFEDLLNNYNKIKLETNH